MPIPIALQAVRTSVRSLAYHVVVEPVREGGPLPGRWPRPVRAAMTVGLIIYLALMISVAFSGLTNPPNDSLGALPVPGRILIAVGVSATLFFLLAASVRMPLPLALLIWAIVAATLAVAAATTFRIAEFLDAEAAPFIWFILMAVLILQWVALLVLCIAQRRRPVTGRWLVALAALVTTSYAVPTLLSVVADPEHSVMSSTATLLPMFVLVIGAAPIAIASGTAFAEVTVRAATWTALSVRPLVHLRVWQVLVVALTGLQIWRAVVLRPTHPWMYATTTALISTTLALTFGCVAWARRRNPRHAPRPTAVMESVPRLAYVISPFMIWPLLWMSAGPELSMPIGLALGSVFALVWTARAVGRGDVVGATIGPPLACGMAVHAAVFAGMPAIQADLVTGLLLSVLLLAMLVAWRIRGVADGTRWMIVALGLALVAIHPYRAILAEPIAAALGFSGVALVFFGLIWRVFTDGRYTRIGGPRFPIETRAFVFGAHSVLAAAAVAMTAYGNWDESFSLELFTQWGDWVMGRFALIAVIVGLIEIGRFHVDPDPAVPVPEYLPARS